MQKAESSIPLMAASGIVLQRFYPTPHRSCVPLKS